MKPLRVGQVTLTMGQGGIENLILSLGRVANTEQVDYRLYCLDAGGELLPEAEKLGMQARIFRRRPGLDWRLVFTLAKTFREDGLNAIHTHNQAAHFYGGLAAKIAGIPVVINTEHSRHYIQEHWRRRLEKRLLSKITNTMVTVSDELRQLAIENDRIAYDKLAVIVNGVDIRRFDDVRPEAVAAFRLENKIPTFAKVLSIVARLHPIKNHRLLLHAVKALTADLPDMRLLIVGDGEERNNLEDLVNELQISGNVLFLGNRSDVPVVLKASDAKVLCSITEGLPLVLLEAMAARTPIIVTKGANRSGLIEYGVNGVVSEERPQELAAAVLGAFSQKDECFEMTAAAYNQVKEEFSIERTAHAYLGLYTQRNSLK